MVLQSLKKMKKNKESNILYGSHNSMTFLPPKHWWGYLGLWIARCQNKTLEEQFNAGARVFDLRVCYDTDALNVRFAHGAIEFKYVKNYSFYDVIITLYELAKKNNCKVYIRLILEKSDNDFECYMFSQLCEDLDDERYYTDHLTFFGGNRKGDWKKLYTFNGNIPDALNNQFVSSMMPDARWYEKICPYLYAKRMNKANKAKMKEVVNLFDFI